MTVLTNFNMGKICCKICGQEFNGVIQMSHLMINHTLTCQEYSDKYGCRFTDKQKEYQMQKCHEQHNVLRSNHAIIICKQCNHTKKTYRLNGKFCSKECQRQYYKDKILKKQERIKKYEVNTKLEKERIIKSIGFLSRSIKLLELKLERFK